MRGKTYQTVFDTGPDGAALRRNLDSLRVDLKAVDQIVLSHWHRDHSGGILEFLCCRKEVITAHHAVNTDNSCKGGEAGEDGVMCANEITVDVHPSRPLARGVAPPPLYNEVVCRLPEDPTVREMEDLGARVIMSREGRAVQGGSVFVSGEIPRVIAWEKGLLGGMRWIETEDGIGEWISDRVSICIYIVGIGG